MPVYPWENPHRCCILLHEDKINTNFKYILRGTEHNNCSMCSHKDTFTEQSKCIKPNEYDRIKQRGIKQRGIKHEK